LCAKRVISVIICDRNRRATVIKAINCVRIIRVHGVMYRNTKRITVCRSAVLICSYLRNYVVKTFSVIVLRCFPFVFDVVNVVVLVVCMCYTIGSNVVKNISV